MTLNTKNATEPTFWFFFLPYTIDFLLSSFCNPDRSMLAAKFFYTWCQVKLTSVIRVGLETLESTILKYSGELSWWLGSCLGDKQRAGNPYCINNFISL